MIDFVRAVENYLGKNILDAVVYNNQKPSPGRIAKYRKLNSQIVKYDQKNFKKGFPKFLGAKLITDKGFIRHNQKRLAKVILGLI